MTWNTKASQPIVGPSVACQRLRELAERQKTLPRKHVLEALERGLEAADPALLLRRHVRRKGGYLIVGLRRFNLSKYERVFLIGGGKAAAGMALQIDKILKDKLTGGVVNVPAYLNLKTRHGRILFHSATHPLPTGSGVRGVEKMLELVEDSSSKDLVVCILSGGGSALMPSPAPGLPLEDLKKTTELFLKAGARIDELNTVRKHLSSINGGRLAEQLYPATVLSLIISDVVGDKIEDIASGPTAPDSSTYADAGRVVRKYQMEKKVPADVRRILQRGILGSLPETPKPGSRIFKRVHNIVVGRNKDSCAAAARSLQHRGYRTLVLTTMLRGESKHIGTALASFLLGPDKTRFSARTPLALVAGGETTVTVKGKGLGGRNQEIVLSAALQMRGLPNVALASMATDGIDGQTMAAGAVADGESLERGLEKKLLAQDFLENNDSHTFFKELDDLIITGPAGTNINDIVAAASVVK